MTSDATSNVPPDELVALKPQEASAVDTPASPIDLDTVNNLLDTTEAAAPSTDPQGASATKIAQGLRWERAQTIFKKYNVDLSPSDWEVQQPSKGLSERVAKPIRMRVRYTCHNCQTAFGHEQICGSCQHRKCAQCTRYPAKKDRKKFSSDRIPPIAPAVNICSYTCHECQTVVAKGVEACSNCHHKICEKCAHDTSLAEETVKSTGVQA